MANKNTGLGKGLSALLGDDFTMNPAQAPRLNHFPASPGKILTQPPCQSWLTPFVNTALSSP